MCGRACDKDAKVQSPLSQRSQLRKVCARSLDLRFVGVAKLHGCSFIEGACRSGDDDTHTVMIPGSGEGRHGGFFISGGFIFFFENE